MLRVTISTENNAFHDDAAEEDERYNPGPELARILRELAEHLDDVDPETHRAGRLTDVNGNSVGEWEIAPG